MVDGDKIQDRKVPLENRQPMIESVDVGFLDSGSGKIESRTRFSFKLKRANGYEAGEYKVTITDARNDQKVGVPTTLIFDGENEVIDRRAMVFNNGDKKPKKDKDVKKVDDDKGDDKKADDKKADDKKTDDDSKAKSDDKPAGDDAADKASSKDPSPAEDAEAIKTKPGGCGCRLAGAGRAGDGALALGLLGLGATLARRKRRAA
jgi:MYXO-CTERM domain-containing protein